MDDLWTVVVAQGVLNIVGPETLDAFDVLGAVVRYSAGDTPFASGDITVPVSQRIIMNHITAKRLLGLLSATLQRHEQAFGVVETDVRRRVRPQG